ncbi:DUF3556 domain-containing protein [Nocardia sp. NBC_00881]|uniref:DUF3556 domain-containing protein n=1 Tax=Nocardia sp. NBC_00881 TaxID=2975995 RepID=UPI0038665743
MKNSVLLRCGIPVPRFPNHDGFGVTDMSIPWLPLLVTSDLGYFPMLGSPRRGLVSLLPSMCQYTGNWATTTWTFAPGAEGKLDQFMPRPVSSTRTRFLTSYPPDVADVAVHRPPVGSQPMRNTTQRYKVIGAGLETIETGTDLVADAVAEQPWLPNNPIPFDMEWVLDSHTDPVFDQTDLQESLCTAPLPRPPRFGGRDHSRRRRTRWLAAAVRISRHGVEGQLAEAVDRRPPQPAKFSTAVSADTSSFAGHAGGAPMIAFPGSPHQRQLSQVPATDDAVAVIADIARTLKSREREIAQAMSAMIARAVDHLDNDPQLMEMFEASVHGNLTACLHVLADDIPLDHLQPTTAAVENAMRLAQREVPSHSLVRAYHMGQNYMLRICHDEIDRRRLPAPLALAVVKRLTEILYAYVEWITLHVLGAYEAERSRWVNARGSVHSSTVHAVLSEDTADTTAFETETGYRLDQTHLALILWRPGQEKPGTWNLLDTQARTLARGLRAEGPALVTAIDRRTAWAWLPFGHRHPVIDTTELHAMMDPADGVRLTVGLPGRARGGFRRSHRQAIAAYFVASVPGISSSHTIVGFGDPGVAVISLLAKDMDSTRAWVREVLGELAVDTDQAAALRSTLSTYYTTSESHVRTAQILTLHRNTVKYRVTKAIEATRVGTAPHDKLDIALALQVCRFLGATVLRRSS